ncbi:Zn-dependent alcohol dehydrogenase [Verticiella sediminum]|uniref:Zn-dependent alcohol dehydrogenase n=1 Tax=Verticiella sediminum TaxID=1247510 RepID=A0A556AJF3_9BURK|nr:Zn-dependent alcohol dehydrogenase [Verticiella sediminum]TSH93006.1 Zn-dependent alcohol dehydrogenase [Verticiella sediminum]
MKAAVLVEPQQPLVIQDIAVRKPGPREVLIRTAAVGVCHSDLHFTDGIYPTPVPVVPGHEAAGVVEAVGSEVGTVKPGDHVVTCLSIFCGYCEHCVSGFLSRCVSPRVRPQPDDEPRLVREQVPVQQLLGLGAFAEQMLVHENACVAIRRDMPLDRAALIGCAAVTGYGAVTRTSRVRPGDTVAVIGCGGIGLCAINAAAIAGAGRIIAIDRVPGKLELARAFGATDTVLADGDVVADVVDMTNGGVHHSFEAVGLKVTTEQAFRMLRRGGTANVIGMIPPGVKIELRGTDFLSEKRIQGSLMGSNRFPVDMPGLVDFYLQGKLHLDKLIASRIGLESINDALDELRRGELARSVVVFDGVA